jgi:DNA-binding GntR family transcriptional regulator
VGIAGFLALYGQVSAANSFNGCRALLEGSGNAVLLETFDRLWLAGELVRHWAADRTPERDYIGEHRQLEEAALARDADAAAALLEQHVSRTAANLVSGHH